MSTRQNKQAGFGHLELLMLVVLVAVLSLVGWLVYKNTAKHNPPSAQVSSSNKPATDSSQLSISVAGYKLVNQQQQTVQLRGVNVSGGGDCVPVGKQPPGILYPLALSSQQTTVAAIANWDVNVVRVTMNEDCWLGINGTNPNYSGINYRNGIVSFIKALHQRNIYTIVDMHLNAPDGIQATAQQAMADADHAITYWQSVASTFKDDPATIFEAYNEPHITVQNAKTGNPWQCWLSGCTITETDQEPRNRPIPNSPPWQSAGMQQIVDAIRSSGATNPIMLGGLNWSQDLSSFLQYLPNDNKHQLIAAYHNYMAAGSRNTENYWNSVIAPIAQKLPVVTSEMGEKDGGSQYVNQYMAWADSHGVSYLAWAWGLPNALGNLALIADLNGTPSSYGQTFYNHFHSSLSGS